MRRLAGLLLYGACLFATGCAVADFGRDITDATVNMFKPSTRDYRDSDNPEDWSVVGNEGRGDRTNDHESDGLTKYLDSPTSQSINRNLRVY